MCKLFKLIFGSFCFAREKHTQYLDFLCFQNFRYEVDYCHCDTEYFSFPLATKLVESVKVLIFKTNIKTLSFFLRVTFAGCAFENDNLNTKLSFGHTITAIKSQFSRNRTLFLQQMEICRYGEKASCDFRASCFGEKLISAHTLRDAVVHLLQSLHFRAALCTRKHCIAE